MFLMNIDTSLPRINTFDGSFTGRTIKCWPYTFRTVSNKTHQIGCRATPNQAQIDGIVQTDTSSGTRHVFCFSEEFRQRSLVVSSPNGEDLSGSITLSTERRRIGSSGKGEEAKGLFTPLRSLFLPQGWPESVSSDYLSYQLWTFPSHVTGWISTSLAGSSMLKALGMETTPAATAGFSAGIKWVTKDGIGALGRFLVGGKLGDAFDEDPRRWRMIAEGITTLGLALEIATQLFPLQFIVLAGSGTLAKATGKGIGRPCFRVIQTHFGIDHNNVGAVAAKEEVWEVTAQLLGLAASVGLLSLLDIAGTPEAVIPVWAVVHGVHVGLRYLALTKLRFPWPNYKRGVALVMPHALYRTVPTLSEVNSNESILGGQESVELRCKLGCSVEEAFGKSIEELLHPRDDEGTVGGCCDASSNIASMAWIYRNEQFVLIWRGGTSYVLLRETAEPIDSLRAMWQAAWLHQRNCHHRLYVDDGAVAEPGGMHDEGERTMEAASANREYCRLLEQSLGEMQAAFPDLLEKASAQGWELHRAVLPVGPHRIQFLEQ